MGAGIVEVRNLTVSYRHSAVLWQVDWQLNEPSLVAVLGPNGAGKSTLLKAILGLVPAASGEVRCFGLPLAKVRRRIGYVPQRESVDWNFPASVLDVVLMGTYGNLRWFQRPGRREKQQAMSCLEQMGIRDLADRQIGQLSGGQQQRTFLARALAQDADLYFMDEPMAGVDAATEEAVFRLLRAMRQAGKTVVVVHHDLRSVRTHFDQALLLNRRVVAAGPATDVFTTANLSKAYGGRVAVVEQGQPAESARGQGP